MVRVGSPLKRVALAVASSMGIARVFSAPAAAPVAAAVDSLEDATLDAVPFRVVAPFPPYEATNTSADFFKDFLISDSRATERVSSDIVADTDGDGVFSTDDNWKTTAKMKDPDAKARLQRRHMIICDIGSSHRSCALCCPVEGRC